MPFPNLDGRPVEYTKEIPDKVVVYVDKCIKDEKLPTRAGLAVYLGISKQTLYNWEKIDKQLMDSLKRLDALQEDEVWQKALKGEYNSNIAKLLLHNHGYSDKTQSENTNINTNLEEDEDEPVEDKLEKVLKRIQKLRKD